MDQSPALIHGVVADEARGCDNQVTTDIQPATVAASLGALVLGQQAALQRGGAVHLDGSAAEPSGIARELGGAQGQGPINI